TADQQYQEAFNEELESFKERVRGRAKIRIERALKEYEEEERKKRMGPGGLDPAEVYESLPLEMQKCFDDKDIQMLQDVISKMDPTVRMESRVEEQEEHELEMVMGFVCVPQEAKIHMKRCIDSGLWVPNARAEEEKDEEERQEEEGEELYEEVKKEDQVWSFLSHQHKPEEILPEEISTPRPPSSQKTLHFCPCICHNTGVVGGVDPVNRESLMSHVRRSPAESLKNPSISGVCGGSWTGNFCLSWTLKRPVGSDEYWVLNGTLDRSSPMKLSGIKALRGESLDRHHPDPLPSFALRGRAGEALLQHT
ncbi:hypothetical protein DNTS_005337, partial [Danionella cerebrum]